MKFNYLKNIHYTRRFIMNSLIKNRFRILTLLILILVLGAATYGFAAQNTVPAGRAGEGSGGITGYAVSNVKYELDANNPNQFDWVYFDLDNAASEVHAAIADGGTLEWVECSASATAWDYECDLNPDITITVENSDALHVAAAE
jgi:hypothetical protein